MAICCRCHDEVPSFSWCFTCLSPLCEFHHQDHRLSIDTRSHEVRTFQDISKGNERVRSVLPPMACPEALGYDCSLFCKTCGYMISAQAMIELHKGHNIIDLETSFMQCIGILQSSSLHVQDSMGELILTFEETKNAVSSLEQNVDSVQSSIQAHFEMIRVVLSKREASLMDETNMYLETKRSRLIAKLDKITDALEACRHINAKVDKVLNLHGEIVAKNISVSDGTAKNCKINCHVNGDSETRENHDFESYESQGSPKNNLKPSKSYVISSTKIIKDRCDYISSEYNNLLSPIKDGQNKFSSNIFLSDDLNFLAGDEEMKELCNVIGTIGTIGDKTDPKGGLVVSHSNSHNHSDKEDDADDDKLLNDRYKFTVQNHEPRAGNYFVDEVINQKVVTVEIKGQEAHLNLEKNIDKPKFVTIGKMSLEINIDNMLLPGYQIVCFVESNTSGGSPHLQIKSEVRRV